MRLAISNIAWDVAEDDVIATLLQCHSVDAIDIAPGKYFPDPMQTTGEEVGRVKTWWAERGIEITGMQALLFGTKGLNVFGAQEVQDAMLQHLTAVCRIGAGLGATRVVFGSPKNRDRSGLSDQAAIDAAIPFFQRLGDIAQSYGVVLCLEPNPTCYGANFMTTTFETSDLITQIAKPAIRLQLDTGALSINGEDPLHVVQQCAPLIGHIHASEPDLVPLGDGGVEHDRVAEVLEQYLPNKIVSIEMLATKDEPHEVSIKRALTVAIRGYRNNSIGGNP